MTVERLDPVDRSGDISIVLTTLPDAESGEVLVRTLLSESLIACGNLVPNVISIFRWEGQVVREREVIVILKTTSASIDQLFSRITELHAYSVPEVVELPVGALARTYGDWVRDSAKVSV